MKIQTKQKYVLLAGMTGFVLGICSANLWMKEYILDIGIFNQFFLGQYNRLEIVYEEYFWYLIKNRGVFLLILTAAAGTKYRKSAVILQTNQRIIAENAQFTGIAAGQGVGFTTGLLHLRKGLGMRETPIRPHSWHCRMQSDYQYDGNRKRPPVWRRHRGSLRPRGRNLGRVEGMTGSCGSGCDPAIHARRLRVYHRPRRLRMASRISIFFAARRFEPLNSMG